MLRIMLASVAAVSALFAVTAAQAQQQCREYTQEYRSNQPDVKGQMCLQADGTWKIMDVSSNSQSRNTGYQVGVNNGAPSFSGHNRNTQTQSRTRIYSSHPDSPTQLVIQDNMIPYVVVQPYRGYGNYQRRDWSPSKRSFNQHHRGPNWQKHWKHHERAMGTKRNR